ncbi:lamin tail domain-containing protein [Candidatus Sumerlaeota bacterium]|nr:lamin tail domain-containing protein [Candidatus Sumerlaeota bacterium]
MRRSAGSGAHWGEANTRRRAVSLRLATLLAILLWPGVGHATLILSEIADPLDKYRARFVEIANTGDTTSTLEGWALRRYSNGSTSYAEVNLASVDPLLPGDSLVVAYNAAAFETFFGQTADMYNGYVSGNGNDVYELTFNGGRVDIYGQVGVNGSGTDWDYQDSVAARRSSATSPSTVWQASEWAIVPSAPRQPMTPGDHAFGPGAQNPDAVVLLPEVAFGSVEPGAHTVRSLVVYNMPSSSSDLAVSGLAFAGGDSAFSLYEFTGPVSLAPGERTDLTIEFAPDSASTPGFEFTAVAGLLCNDPLPPLVSFRGRTRNDRSVSYIREQCQGTDPPGPEVYSLNGAIVTAQGLTAGWWAAQDYAAPLDSTPDTGAWVIDSSNEFENQGVRMGDRIRLDVRALRVRGMVCLQAIEGTLEIVSRENPLPEPYAIASLGDLNDACEGLLIGIPRAWIANGGNDAARWQEGVAYTLSDGSKSAPLHVARGCADWNLRPRPANSTPFQLVGVGVQTDSSWPGTEGSDYGIAARGGRCGNGSATWAGIDDTETDVCLPDGIAVGEAVRNPWIHE